MTALIIIAVIVLIIVCLLNFPVYAVLKYYGGKPEITVKYLWLTLYPRPEDPNAGKGKKTVKEPKKKAVSKSPPKQEPENRQAKKTELSETVKTETHPSEKPENKDKSKDKKEKAKPEKKEPLADRINSALDELTEKKDAFLLLWGLCSGHLKKLGKKISISGLKLDFAAANEDAYDAAMLYGKLNAAVYNILALVKCVIKVTVRSIQINCLFNTPSEKTRYDGECVVRLRPASVLNAVFAIVFGFLVRYKKYAPALGVFMKK